MKPNNELKWSMADKEVRAEARVNKIPFDISKVKALYITMFAEGTPESVMWQEQKDVLVEPKKAKGK